MTVQCHNPRDGYRCVGGLLDGQMRIPRDGQRVFYVEERPSTFDLVGYSPGALAPDLTVESQRYELTRTLDGGLVWLRV